MEIIDVPALRRSAFSHTPITTEHRQCARNVAVSVLLNMLSESKPNAEVTEEFIVAMVDKVTVNGLSDDMPTFLFRLRLDGILPTRIILYYSKGIDNDKLNRNLLRELIPGLGEFIRIDTMSTRVQAQKDVIALKGAYWLNTLNITPREMNNLEVLFTNKKKSPNNTTPLE
jgi:hypothetical protein